jgi:hypothetical protein
MKTAIFLIWVFLLVTVTLITCVLSEQDQEIKALKLEVSRVDSLHQNFKYYGQDESDYLSK